MSKVERTTFICDGCDYGYEHDPGLDGAIEYIGAAPHGWRVLSWRGGWQGDEHRETYFCPSCALRVLKALDMVLETIKNAHDYGAKRAASTADGPALVEEPRPARVFTSRRRPALPRSGGDGS